MSNAEHEVADFLTALRDAPKGASGRRRDGVRAVVPVWAITLAGTYVTESRADVMIEGWLDEDHPARTRRVGRPSTVPVRAWVVGSLACALAGLPVSLLQVHQLLAADQPRAARQALGLPVSGDDREDAAMGAARRQVGYWSVARAAKRVALTFDPRPYPAKRGLTVEEIAAIDDARDPADVAMRQQRADTLAARLLLAGWTMLPEQVRSRWGGDLTVDATVVPVFGKLGHKASGRVVKGACSPEVNAGWHAKTQDNRDRRPGQGSAALPGEFTQGYDAHLAQVTGPGVGWDFPALVVGLSLDTPSFAPGANAVAMLAEVRRAGLPAGIVTVDRGYSQLAAANFHLPVRALGYGLAMSYKTQDTGTVQASYEGAIMVEGTWYSPCMPRTLVTAVADHQADRIDQATCEARLAAREQYRLRIKEVKANADLVMRCPAQGPGARMSCPQVRPGSVNVPGRRYLPVVVNVPSTRGAVCTNRASVTIPGAAGARFRQEHPYLSERWRAVYTGPRNQMEGKNRYVKNATEAALAVADHRRFRGLGKQLLAVLVKLVAANVTTIMNFLDGRETSDAGGPAPVGVKRGRPLKPGLAAWLPARDGPVRIAGTAPGRRKAA